jgi:hypothetical protein
VLLYGGFLAGLLALLYLPTSSRLQARARQARDQLFPLPPQDRQGWESQISQRKSLEEVLQLHVGPWHAFQIGVAILAPLLTSMLSVLLPARL